MMATKWLLSHWGGRDKEVEHSTGDAMIHIIAAFVCCAWGDKRWWHTGCELTTLQAVASLMCLWPVWPLCFSVPSSHINTVCLHLPTALFSSFVPYSILYLACSAPFAQHCLSFIRFPFSSCLPASRLNSHFLFFPLVLVKCNFMNPPISLIVSLKEAPAGKC